MIAHSIPIVVTLFVLLFIIASLRGKKLTPKRKCLSGVSKQIVCSGIQVRVGDDRLAARAVPVFGEAFQLVNDFILIGCHVVGGGEFDAEHGLVSIQGDFLCMA